MEKLETVANNAINLIDLMQLNGFGYAKANEIIKQKDIRVNGEKVNTNVALKPGDKVLVYTKTLPAPKYTTVFEDENILVVNKASGIEITGVLGLEGLIGNVIPVHRLDRNTKGLVIFAKNKQSEQSLLASFKDGGITKKYMARVVGIPANFDGRVFTANLVKDAKSALVKIYDKPTKNSVTIKTSFKLVSTDKKTSTSLVEVGLFTGKTHQIRAHLAHLGFPIVGDGKYGLNKANSALKENTQNLCCYYLKLNSLPTPLTYLNGKEFFIDVKF